ncbi:MAG: ribosome-associated translation inhibitor RaiA [Anaerolineae bacterium]|nr:ribosome-associated translation inhibitor RaiA [Anaerolineae bacterium]
MDIIISGRNLQVTDQLRELVESKVSKLDRYLPNISEARVDLASYSTKSSEDRQVVQLTLRANGALLRAEDKSSDLRSSLDAVLGKMSRQIERYKGKHWRSKSRVEALEPLRSEAQTDSEEQVIRIKRFETMPMYVDEAIDQMELLGHDFYVFYNVETEGFAVIYRRHDGGYGLLLPELA